MNTRVLACVVALMVSGLAAIGCGAAASEEGDENIWEVEQALLESEGLSESEPDLTESEPVDDKGGKDDKGGSDLDESEGGN